MRSTSDRVLLLRKVVFIALTVGTAWWSAAGQAWAQTPNYSVLEEIFQQPVTSSVAGRIQLEGDVVAAKSAAKAALFAVTAQWSEVPAGIVSVIHRIFSA